MKKKLIFMMALLLVLTTALGACSNNSGENSGDTPEGTVVEENFIPDYDVDEYVKLADYKGLPYHFQEVDVTDEEVENQIQSLLQYATISESVTEGIVEDGDTINVAFVGKIDGEEFDGGSSESYDITIGTTSMIDGFVEGLIGKEVGETVTLNLQFPEEYPNSPDLQGKDVVFDVTINSKRIDTVPELTDDFVKDYYDMDTVDELRESIRQDLYDAREYEYVNSVKDQLWSVVMQESEIISVPDVEEEKAQAEIEALKNDYIGEAESYGVDFSEYLETYLGMDESTLDDMLNGYKEDITKTNMVMGAIAKKEGVELSDEEYEEMLLDLLESNGLDEETFEDYYGMPIREYGDANGFRKNFFIQKIIDTIVEQGKEVSKEEFDEFISEKLYSDEDTEIILDDEAVAPDEAAEGPESSDIEGDEETSSEEAEG